MSEPTLTATGTRWRMNEVGAPLVASSFELPRPGPGEALVSVAGCGVCHTDLYTQSGADPSGYTPCVLGHEGAGVVEKVSEVHASHKPWEEIQALGIKDARKYLATLGIRGRGWDDLRLEYEAHCLSDS